MPNSDPHATDMGRMESEPAFVHYTSSPLQRLLGFGPHNHCPIW